ncbi:hypothetical protein I4U23_004448 [Adineta vaga]|nr:hypothetical protein I4U23_004448 [Adineta vaga]
MFTILIYLLFPAVNSLIIVELHRQSIYQSNISCSSIGNNSLANQSSINDCIRTCHNDYYCQTAVYFKNKNICSMFAELCGKDSIKSTENTSATVICCKKNYESFPTCSSTVTTDLTITSTKSTIITGTEQSTHTFSMMFSVTTATTTVTATPPCASQSRSSGMLFSVTNPSSSNYPAYNCYAYTWIANKASVTLSFFFRHDLGGWMLDEVNVYHGLTQIIINGGFESGSLTAWNYSGSCGLINTGTAYHDNQYAKTGDYYYYDRCAFYGDTISQTFSTVVGDTYVISFWLTNYLCCSGMTIVNITIT